LYENLKQHGTQFTPGLSNGLRAFFAQVDPKYPSRYEENKTLIELRFDVPIPFDEVLAPRESKDAAAFVEATMAEEEDVPIPLEMPDGASVPPPPAPPTPTLADASEAIGRVTRAPEPKALIVHEAELAPPKEWERGLDPRSMKEARLLATDMHQSRMFGAYGTPQAVLSTVMLGRELGLPALAALRSVHIIDGKHTLSAALMVALILKSGLAEYFEPLSFDDTQATYETKRVGGRNPIRLTHTLEMARTAGLIKPNSNWEKVPTDMLVARAQSRLARMVYPDLLAGLYTPDELEDARAEKSAAAVA
jgi:hypothetical protein